MIDIHKVDDLAGFGPAPGARTSRDSFRTPDPPSYFERLRNSGARLSSVMCKLVNGKENIH